MLLTTCRLPIWSQCLVTRSNNTWRAFCLWKSRMHPAHVFHLWKSKTLVFCGWENKNIVKCYIWLSQVPLTPLRRGRRLFGRPVHRGKELSRFSCYTRTNMLHVMGWKEHASCFTVQWHWSITSIKRQKKGKKKRNRMESLLFDLFPDPRDIKWNPRRQLCVCLL